MMTKTKKICTAGTKTTKVGSRLKKMRIERNLTQAELGNKMGIADSAIRRYESNKVMPRPKTIERFANALNCRISDLSGDMGDPFDWDDEVTAEPDSPLDLINAKLPDEFEIRELPGWDDAESENFDMITLIFPDKKTVDISIDTVTKAIDEAMEFLTFHLMKFR